MRQHPAPWWYRMACRLAPSRVREIPEARHPERVLLRQVALIERVLYLQQIASDEDTWWLHHHEGPTLCVGLWGGYTERRLVAGERKIRAPYLTFMSGEVVHQVYAPQPGHTSLFWVIRRDRDRRYIPAATIANFLHWRDHVKKQVRRI